MGQKNHGLLEMTGTAEKYSQRNSYHFFYYIKQNNQGPSLANQERLI